MKKSLLALAVLGAFAGAAQAQSSVTLYGIIDAGITYSNNQGGNSSWQMTSGVLQGSRWGLKGAEDLGGGLKAIFTIENGFNVNNGTLGQGGREFGRQAYVGLSSATAGTVTLGRQYDSVVDFLGPLASGSQWAGYIGAHPFDNDNLNNSFRVNNAVKYTSLNYSGFSFDALYGFSNKAGGFANNRTWSMGAGYANGPLTVGAGFLYLQNPKTSIAADPTGANSDGSFATTFFGNAASNQQTWGLGGAYAFGPATVGLVYTNSKTQSSLFNDTLKAQNAEANFKYMITPALQLGAAYTYTWAKDDATNLKPKFHQVNLGADYWLSKRTDIYTAIVYQKAAGDGLGPNGTKIANINGLAASDTDKQVAIRLGLRHKF